MEKKCTKCHRCRASSDFVETHMLLVQNNRHNWIYWWRNVSIKQPQKMFEFASSDSSIVYEHHRMSLCKVVSQSDDDEIIDAFVHLVQIATQKEVVLTWTRGCVERASQTLDPYWAMEYKNREWNCHLLIYFLSSSAAVWMLHCFVFFFFPNRRKFSDSIVEMLVVCATTVHRVGLQTAPNELCPRVPLMAWNTCAFTIQAIGTISLGSLCLAVWCH